VASVRQESYRDEEKYGMSKVAASYIFRYLTANKFEWFAGQRWDVVVGDAHIPRLCVATDDDGSGLAGMERLSVRTLAGLKEKTARLVFAAAQSASSNFDQRSAATRRLMGSPDPLES
jgi:hypothetical protein